MKKKVATLVFIPLMTYAIVALGEFNIPKGEDNPYAVNVFKSPQGYEEKIDNYRKTWQRVSAIDFSALHWNHYVSIFMNQDVDVYRNNFKEYLMVEEMEEEDEEYEPDYQHYQAGTMFIKEHYIATEGRPGDPSQLSIMIKRDPGYDPEFGDWEYIQSDEKGSVLMSGNSHDAAIKKACLDCHANMAERDFIFALNYKSGFVNQ